MMKKQIMAVLALAMIVAVLAGSTAHAQSQQPPALRTVTNQASASSVAAGEPVTFHMTVTNNQPYDLGPVTAKGQFFADGPPVEFVSASSSQGQCYFEPNSGVNGALICNLGTLPAGATADIDFVVVPQAPQESGLMTNMAYSFRPPVGGEPMDLLSSNAPASVYVYPA